MKYVTLILAVEAKDEFIDGTGHEPATDGEVAEAAADLLCDATRREYQLPWRVVSVEHSS